MERCTNCRARAPGEGRCRRCGMDLERLLALEATAERLIRVAVAYLMPVDRAAAIAVLNRARALRRDPFVELLLGFAAQPKRENPMELGSDPAPRTLASTGQDKVG